jgi:hypothetical protein
MIAIINHLTENNIEKQARIRQHLVYNVMDKYCNEFWIYRLFKKLKLR